MNNISTDAARQYLSSLNLDYIVEMMCSTTYPLPRWSREDALHCSKLYKNFLLLQKMHRTENLVPTREIDEFWHNHILHTKNYVKDCQAIFGHYLHHQPESPDENPQLLAENFLKTKQLYLTEFAEPLTLIGSPHEDTKEDEKNKG